MTLIEAAEALGVQPATLRQQIAHGKLRARKVGRDWTVTTREVERYRRESRRVTEASEWCAVYGCMGIASEDSEVCPRHP